MGLKCSLLGHSFDETDVEREREERGSEVVTVVNEVERCSRCGETRVISTNKEVTSIVEPDDVELDDTAETSGSSTALGNVAADADGSSGSGFESGSDLEEFESPGDPDEEDAEILQDDRPSDRRPGQWPDDDDDWDPGRLTRPDGPDGPAAPDAAGESVGDDDATDPDEVVEEPTAAPTDPKPTADTGGDFIDAEADPANANVGSAAETDDTPATGSSTGGTSVPEGTFACPECGFTTSAENTPLRAGDACPECQRGYLEAGE
jgi:hypothetical protein